MYLEKLYDKLNHDFFEGQLERPVITVQSTVRAYGHYTLYDAWSIKGEGYRELNIGTGTLDRPIENVFATLLHEMCHQYNDVALPERPADGGSCSEESQRRYIGGERRNKGENKFAEVRLSGMRDDCTGNENGERNLRGLYVRDEGGMRAA